VQGQIHRVVAAVGEGVGRRGQARGEAGEEGAAAAAAPAAGMQAEAAQGGGAALPVAVGGERAARLQRVGGTRCGDHACPCDPQIARHASAVTAICVGTAALTPCLRALMCNAPHARAARARHLEHNPGGSPSSDLPYQGLHLF
jgi:hypothetical protein